jgi:hypothetical protein
VFIDRGDPGYSETGNWFDWSPGYGGSSRYADPGSTATANWTLTGLAAGTYQVQATWVADSAPAAPYRIFDGATLRGTVNVDQRVEPSGPVFGGRPFQTLGTFSVTSGTLRVELSAVADGWSIADAVRIVRIS